jgi:hypothetical protein
MRSKWSRAFIAVIGVVSLSWSSVNGVVWGTVIGLVVLLLTAALLYSIRLTTEVREDGVYIQFAPFHRSFRRIPSAQMERVEAIETGLLTYGGIGIRWNPNTIASVNSRWSGIKIDRPDPKSMLIGSQDAEKLAQTVDNLT